VFNGETESWPIHLRATQSFLPGLKKGCTKYINVKEPFSPTHRKAYQFFTRVISWYDICSSATTGLQPWAPRFCLREEVGFINFEDVLGCENTPVIAILEIASLDEWKSKAEKLGVLDTRELVDRASVIEKSVEEMLRKYSGGDKRFAEFGSLNLIEQLIPESLDWSEQLKEPLVPEAMSRKTSTSAITCIFASAALVYLNVVVYGPRAEHPKIKKSVSRTIIALRALHDRKALGILSWPLCLAGCMATDWQQICFFRQLSFEFEDVSDVTSGNLKKSFLIMEECWRLRRERKMGSDWLQAMESLNMKILLI
jgi:C6 transcription factor Pro1